MKMFWCVLLVSFGYFLYPFSIHARPHPLKVVATFSVLGDLVKNVGGDAIDLTVLVGADGDIHTFEPTPYDDAVLSKADIVFENGLHLDPWLDDLYRACASKAKRVVVSESIPLIKIDKETDPHVWHDVANATVMVKNIQNGLSSIDPQHAFLYQRNASMYLEKLDALDRWVKEQLQIIPVSQRKLVTSHDTFGYFCRRYGFQLVGTALESMTTEAADPSAAHMAELVKKIQQTKVKVIFTENTHSPKLMQVLAQDAGVRVATSLYTDASGKPGGDGDTYIKMMQHNVKVLTEYLK